MKIYYIIILLLTVTICNESYAGEPSRKSQEKLLSSIDVGGMLNNSFTVSNNLRRVAFRMKKDNRQCAVVDGIEGSTYDEVSSPVFSADNKHFVYSGRNGKQWYLVIDHTIEQKIESGSIAAALYAPDSKSVVYVLNENHKYSVVFGGVKSNQYDYIDENSISFSADGSKMAFSATKGDKQLIVYDNVEGTAYDQVGFPIISANGKHFAYWGVADNKAYVILDNQESRSYDAVNAIIFNEVGSSCAYHAQRGGKHIIVIDGEESLPFEVAHSLQFSPDGKHIAYGMAVTGNGKKSEGHHEDEENFTHYAVLDGTWIGPYETVVEGGIIFSADAKQFAFKAEKHDEFFMVLNNKEGKHYNDVLQATLTFSGDNKLAFAAENNSVRMVSADGVESTPYNDIYSVTYSPDNSFMVYTARKENQEFVVLNGNRGKAYDTIMGIGGIHFDSPSSFHYLSMKGNNIYLVEENVNPGK